MKNLWFWIFHLNFIQLVLTQESSKPKIPKLTFEEFASKNFEDLKSNLSSSEFFDNKISAFIITGLEKISGDYSDSIRQLRAKSPECLDEIQSKAIVDLDDGSTRTTFATIDRSYPGCLKKAFKSIGKVFNEIDDAFSKFLDDILKVKWTSNSQIESRMISGSPIKEHLHVYKKNSQKSQTGDGYLVPFHVDNGLYLTITPFPGLGLLLRNQNAQVLDTSDLVASNELLVLVGKGLTDWLLQSEPEKKSLFYPVSHGVSSFSGGLEVRSIFARMKVADNDAIPDNQKSNAKIRPSKFSDIFNRNFEAEKTGLCDVDLNDPELRVSDPWISTIDRTCAHGEAYCWMGCRPLPKSCPSVWDAKCWSSENNVSCSTEKGGKPMDPTCQWECRADIDAKEDSNNDSTAYCTGKMSMFMLGFDISGNSKNPCIVLFIEPWTLDTPFKFWIGCLGVAVLGFAIEGLISFRRGFSESNRVNIFCFDGCCRGFQPRRVTLNRKAKKWLLLFCFLLNLVLGYLAMLVAMTYSVELFVSVVLGLAAGHAYFNLDQPVSANIDPCCSASSQGNCDPNCSNNLTVPVRVDTQQEIVSLGSSSNALRSSPGSNTSNGIRVKDESNTSNSANTSKTEGENSKTEKPKTGCCKNKAKEKSPGDEERGVLLHQST